MGIRDSSHIFWPPEQVPDELASLLDFTLSVLRALGFEDFQDKLSTRPEGKAVGEDALWEMATDGLRSALESAGIDYVVDEGGGAFYGPKIDVDVTDAIGRPWQLSTIQLDFNLPERFGLEYVGADGGRHQPVMIHRALMGSVERFFGVLLEHYAGAFPLWLAPEQVRVLPVAEEHQAYAELVVDRLSVEGFRAQLAPADEPLGKRVRAGKVAKVPHVLAVLFRNRGIAVWKEVIAADPWIDQKDFAVGRDQLEGGKADHLDLDLAIAWGHFSAPFTLVAAVRLFCRPAMDGSVAWYWSQKMFLFVRVHSNGLAGQVVNGADVTDGAVLGSHDD